MDKGGAFELSIGTVVVLVVAMALLIMGLVLVKNIGGGATKSIDEINRGVMDSISELFPNEGSNLAIKLGNGKLARIKADDELFGVGFGARTKDGSAITDLNRLKYKLVLEKPSGKNCASVLGEKGIEDLFITSLNIDNQFDEYEGANAFAIIELKVPKGTTVCSQKVSVQVKDSEDVEGYYVTGSFRIEILKSGLF